VASVKATGNAGGPLRVIGRVDADGINFTNMMLRLYIQRAFGIKPYQLIGPDWIDTERFVIVAKASAPAPQEKLMEMLRTLLAERFKLAFHRETKEIPVYALVVTKNGPKLKEATDDGPSNADGGDNGELIFSRVTMDILAGVLAASVDRPVVDETGLKGKYNFALAWAEGRSDGERVAGCALGFHGIAGESRVETGAAVGAGGDFCDRSRGEADGELSI
jgi:uncharacterized protein (TIGR03435 family)